MNDAMVKYQSGDNPAAKMVVKFIENAAIKKGDFIALDCSGGDMDSAKLADAAADIIIGVADRAYTAAEAYNKEIVISVGPGVVEARIDGTTDVAAGDLIDIDVSGGVGAAKAGSAWAAGTIVGLALEAQTDALSVLDAAGAGSTTKIFLLPPLTAVVVA